MKRSFHSRFTAVSDVSWRRRRKMLGILIDSLGFWMVLGLNSEVPVAPKL